MANKAVLDLLRQRFGRAKAVSGGSYRIPCPTCEQKNARKMKRYITPGWSVSSCFICHTPMQMSELLHGEASEWISRQPDTYTGEDDYPYAKIQPYEKLTKLTEVDKQSEVIQFLEKDHLHNLEYYSSLGIGYIELGSGTNIKFESGHTINTADSLFFPVFHNGEYVGWQLRFIPGTVNGERLQYMRYLHMFPKGNYLFNYDQAKKFQNVVVVEGVKKALKCGNAVATFGKGISSRQKQLIQQWKSITLVLDGEPSAQQQARALQEEFTSNGRKVVNVDLRNYGFESPDDTTTEELKNIVMDVWKKN